MAGTARWGAGLFLLGAAIAGCRSRWPPRRWWAGSGCWPAGASLWGLYALVFAIPLGALRGVSLGGLTIGAVEALTAAIIACWLARQIARRESACTGRRSPSPCLCGWERWPGR